MKKLLATALIGAVSVIGIVQPANATRITPERRYVNHVNNTLYNEGFNTINELTLLEYGQSLCEFKRSGGSIASVTFSILENNRNSNLTHEAQRAGSRTIILAGATADAVLCPTRF